MENKSLEIKHKNYTIIFTPHSLKRISERKCKQGEIDYFIKKTEQIGFDIIYLIKTKSGHFICRKIFNKRRLRVEVEVISFCPNNYFDVRAILIL